MNKQTQLPSAIDPKSILNADVHRMYVDLMPSMTDAKLAVDLGEICAYLRTGPQQGGPTLAMIGTQIATELQRRCLA